jgi:hypothetical protein
MTEAYDWYESKRIGLGLEFLNEVDEYFNRIVQNPKHYQAHRDQRVAVMSRFPYKIVYELENEVLIVFAVYHDKRNPKSLTDRKK